MKARLMLGVLALVVLSVAPAATAQVVPPPPTVPAPPEQVQPLLTLLAAPGGVVTEPGCAALGTVLGLGSLVIPGIPGTLKTQTGIDVSNLPIKLQPELVNIVATLLFVQGSGCGLLPLAAERTYCASDDDLAAAIPPRDQFTVPGLPVNPGDFVPQPVPTAGAIVDTFRALATLGVPGAADVVAAFDNVGKCGLRSRFTNIEPPAVPPDASLTTPPPPQDAPTEPAPLPAANGTSFGAAPVIPRASIVASGPIAAPVSSQRLPISIVEHLPHWLQWLVIAALIAFLYRSFAPRVEPPL